MDMQAIHAVFLQATIDCAKQCATAKDLAAYLDQAARGMRYNAAFRLSGADFLATLESEKS